MIKGAPDIQLTFLGHRIGIDVDDPLLRELLQRNFEAMAPTIDGECEFLCTVHGAQRGPFELFRSSSLKGSTHKDAGDLIRELESQIVIWLQIKAPRYLFIHSAALVRRQKIHLLVGRPGSGKSTTAFGLTSHGFRLATDEMIAVDPVNGELEVFSRAVCLNQAPPKSYPPPVGTLVSTRGIHIPLASLGGAASIDALPVSSIICLDYDPQADFPSMRPCVSAEALTRLYPNILNALAHEDGGLRAASRIVRRCSCYLMTTADLGESCTLIKKTLDSAPG